MTSRRQKSRNRRTRHRGAGWTDLPSVSISPGNVVHTPNPNPPDCLSVPSTPLPRPFGGLPGMKGGSRRGGMSMPGVPVPQQGGRYEMSLSPLDASQGIVPTPALASRIGCEMSRPNSLNLRGGAASDHYEVGQSDISRLQLQNAGYANNFQVLSNGIPLTIQTPYAAGSFNRACLTTGGSRKRRASKRSGSKRSGSKRSGSKRSGSKRSQKHRSLKHRSLKHRVHKK